MSRVVAALILVVAMVCQTHNLTTTSLALPLLVAVGVLAVSIENVVHR